VTTSDLAPIEASVASAPRRGGRPATGRRSRVRLAPYLFAAPAVVLYVVFMLIPVLYAIWLSLRAYRLQAGGTFGRRVEVFVGLENYVGVLSDPELLASFGRLAICSSHCCSTCPPCAPSGSPARPSSSRTRCPASWPR
jgi:multiple sugar transport system permease protein